MSARRDQSEAGGRPHAAASGADARPPSGGTRRRVHARGRARREAILDAAARLFARGGFRGTGLIGLGRAVGISHAGLLHHFGTKEQLLHALVEQRDAERPSVVDRLEHLRGLAALRGLERLGEDALGDELHVRLLIVLTGESLQHDDPLNAYFRARYASVRAFVADAVRDGQADGEIRADADPDAIGAQLVSFAAGNSLHWLLDPEGVDVAASYRAYLDRLISDLRA